jgi:hypothetical protein
VEYEGRRPAFDSLAHRCTIRKFDCIDAGAVQDKRQEVPDAGFFVHYIAKGSAVRRERRRFDGLWAAGFGRRWSRRLGHAVLACSNRGK